MDRTALGARIRSRISLEDRGFTSLCWISDRAAHPSGYTKIIVDGVTWLTHRLSYEVFVRPIPDGLQIDHLCRVTACCNPAHLEPVTCRTNLVRGTGFVAQQLLVTHCPRGHEYTEANTYHRPDRPEGSSRECLTCRNTWRQRQKKRPAALPV